MYKPRTLNILLATTITATLVSPVRAADHLDAPLLSGNGDKDLNDLYAFQSPVNPDNTVLILTVNPFAGMVSGNTFNPNVSYDFLIDNDGDAVADVSYTTTFSAPVAGSQVLTTLRNGVASSAGSTETDLPVIGGGMLRAGLFDDPFFFDLVGFQNGLSFTGDDAFAGADVSAIVLEVPSSELTSGPGAPNIGVWARTFESGSQVDRIGRPAINTVLIPSGRKDEFNQASPAGDFATFGADVNAAIAGLSDASNANALTPILLPDILTLDTSDPSGFLNGRGLTDDVIDAELTLLTASPTPIGDGVDANDVAFLNAFPYLAPPNLIPEPASFVLLVTGLGLLGTRKAQRPRFQ